MCGGSLEIIPCSHVGHMFRNAMPYSWGDNGMQILIKNSLRLAEVWMDGHKKLYYDRIFYNINVSIWKYNEVSMYYNDRGILSVLSGMLVQTHITEIPKNLSAL